MGAKTKQPHVKLYWREGRDIVLRNRLDQDIRAGRGSASEICRRALAEHYGLEPRPTLPDPGLKQLADLTEATRRLTDQLAQQNMAQREALANLTAQVAQLQAQVAQFAALTAQLQAQVTTLTADNQRLRQLLLAATFGDKASKQAAERAALALVRAASPDNGNGDGRA